MFRDEEASACAKMAIIRCGKHVDQNTGRTNLKDFFYNRLFCLEASGYLLDSYGKESKGKGYNNNYSMSEI